MTAIKVSMGIILDSKGKILIAQRNLQKNFGGMWEFPGGKIETSETPEAALIRELREELNIDTSLSCLAPLSFASHHYDANDDQDAFHLLMTFLKKIVFIEFWKLTLT